MRALVGTIAAGLTLPGCTPTPDDSTTGATSTDTTAAGDTSSSGTTTSSSTTTTDSTTTGTTAVSDTTTGSSTDSGATAGSTTGSATTTGSSTDSGTTDPGTTDSGTTDSGTTAGSSDSATTTGPPANPLRVFVTSQTHNGNYGGTAGADTFCNDLALAASLSGTYTAWLSTSTEDAASRIDPTGSPYVRIDGTVIANDLTDLLDGTLDAQIDVDESSVMVFGDVWTGTVTDGTADPAHCSDWTADAAPTTGRCGSSSSTSSTWTNNITPSCGAGLRLYCFEQG